MRSSFVRACACVRLYVWERERERERDKYTVGVNEWMNQNVVLHELYAEAEERVQHQGHNRTECFTPEHKQQHEYYGCLTHERQVAINETNYCLCYPLIQFWTNWLGFMENGIKVMPFEANPTPQLLTVFKFFQKVIQFLDIRRTFVIRQHTYILLYKFFIHF
jgi:hypothetical protein